jgi:hypothetical protein
MSGRDIPRFFPDMGPERANHEDVLALQVLMREVVELCVASDPTIGSVLCDLFGLDRRHVDHNAQAGGCGLATALKMLHYACAEASEGSATHGRLLEGIRLLVPCVPMLH